VATVLTDEHLRHTDVAADPIRNRYGGSTMARPDPSERGSGGPPPTPRHHPVVLEQQQQRIQNLQLRVADWITGKLKTNTQLTREIHTLTAELHKRFLGNPTRP